jgi:hypothetical protein
LTVAVDLTFVTPLAGLLALAVLPPVIVFMVSASRNARGRALLRLPPPRSSQRGVLLAVAAVPLLLGLAAAGPALRRHVGRHVRTDAQAIFVFDTSRSMAAAASFGATSRFAQAQQAAIKLRHDAIPDIPSGVVSFTTQLIPHLFPTPNEAAFNSTVTKVIGVLKPPPPFFTFGVSGTSFGPLATLRNQGYFNPTTTHRFAIVLTDGESGPFDPVALRQALSLSQPVSVFPGRPIFRVEPPVSLLVVRVGTPTDKIYDSLHRVEAAYRAPPQAAANTESLARSTHGEAFPVTDLAAASAALKRLTGSGHASLQGVKTKTIALAPWVVLAAFAPLGLVLRRRNLANI